MYQISMQSSKTEIYLWENVFCFKRIAGRGDKRTSHWQSVWRSIKNSTLVFKTDSKWSQGWMSDWWRDKPADVNELPGSGPNIIATFSCEQKSIPPDLVLLLNRFFHLSLNHLSVIHSSGFTSISVSNFCFCSYRLLQQHSIRHLCLFIKTSGS